jgi:hypothetical protein
VLRGASVLLFALLAAAWLVVAARTAAGAARGRLFLPGTPASPPTAVTDAAVTGPDLIGPDAIGAAQ